jgi:hypothetical protein
MFSGNSGTFSMQLMVRLGHGNVGQPWFAYHGANVAKETLGDYSDVNMLCSPAQNSFASKLHQRRHLVVAYSYKE